MKLKKCQNCGKTFSCEDENDCWCESYQIHRKDMALIMSRFTDCLCPGCLSVYSET